VSKRRGALRCADIRAFRDFRDKVLSHFRSGAFGIDFGGVTILREIARFRGCSLKLNHEQQPN
jgi:hypothetical protein